MRPCRVFESGAAVGLLLFSAVRAESADTKGFALVDGAVPYSLDVVCDGNPAGTRISAYRNYGRFGMFPTATIKAGETGTFRYRFLVAAGELPSAEVIQAACNAFTGKSDAGPPVTTKRAE